VAERNGEKGWLFHDWDHYQLSSEEIEAKREAARKRQRRRRQRLAEEAQKDSASGSPDDDVTRDKRRDRGGNGSDVTRESRPPTPAQPNHKSQPSGREAPASANTLVAELIDHCPGGRPPGRVVGQVAKEIGVLLEEGIPYADVRSGLQVWQAKTLHPSALASVVHEVRTAGSGGLKPRNQQETEAYLRRAMEDAVALDDMQDAIDLGEADERKAIER
jgi:hypothetical protein